MRVAGGRPGRRALAQLAGGQPRRVPPHQRLHRRQRVLGGHDDGRPGRGQPGGARTSGGRRPRRRRARAAAAAARASRMSTAGSPARTPARHPGWRRRSRGSSGTCATMCPAWLATTGTPGKARPISSAVRSAPTLTARSRRPPHAGQAQDPASAPHHAHCGTPPAAGQRAAARRTRTAPPRGRTGRRAPARSRGGPPARARPPTAVPLRAASQARCGMRAAAAASSRAASSEDSARTIGAAGRERRARRRHRSRPAALAPLLGHDRPRRRPHDEVAAGQVRAQGGHVAGVPVRRLRVDEGVVAVVPDDRPAAGRRTGREDAGPRADDDPDAAAQDAHELPVPPLGTLVGGQGRQRARLARVRQLGHARGRRRARPGRRRGRRPRAARAPQRASAAASAAPRGRRSGGPHRARAGRARRR